MASINEASSSVKKRHEDVVDRLIHLGNKSKLPDPIAAIRINCRRDKTFFSIIYKVYNFNFSIELNKLMPINFDIRHHRARPRIFNIDPLFLSFNWLL
jgi:Cdc6-like AAA superfamily ATPase